MGPFRFNLERIRDYKEQVFETEKNMLRQLRDQKRVIDEKVERLEEFVRAKNREFQAKQCQGLGFMELEGYRFYLENARSQLDGLRIEQKRAESAVEDQLKATLAASQEVSGLDKLEEKQLEDYQKLVVKDQELLISEFVSSKMIREKNPVH